MNVSVLRLDAGIFGSGMWSGGVRFTREISPTGAGTKYISFTECFSVEHCI